MGFIADSPKTWGDAIKSMPEPEVTEAEMLGVLDERLANDSELFKRLVNMRGGCTCFISPPCNNCINPLTIEEAESLGLI